MSKIIVLLLIFIASATIGSAQSVFMLKGPSTIYDLRITVSKCDDDTCEGPGKVELLRKNSKAVFQTIKMPNIFLELGQDRKPTANLIELYGENNSGVVFDDFNFDGVEDIALRNGNNGGYGGPSYDILLYSPAQRRFVNNRSLTKLASENLGLFRVDKKARTIETFSKSGCCWHQTIRYRVTNNRPVKVYEMTEDATGADDKVRITTKKLVNGRWRTTRRLINKRVQ